MDDQAKEYWENNGSWIWDKSLTLGKKILVTGFVITSAPVILPPLVVISALGLACSVPYGIFLASYACTEKLMSKLLPIPATLHGGEYASFGYDFDVENEEEELKRGVEMRLEQEENEEKSSEDVDMKGIGEKQQKEEEELMIEKNKDVEVEICGVTIEIEEGETTGSNVREEDEVPLEVTSISVEVCQGGNKEENEELIKETTELIEKLRDEGAGKEKQSAVHEGAGGGQKKDDANAGETVPQSRDNRVLGVKTRKIDRKEERNGQTAPSVQKEGVLRKRAGGENIREEDRSVARHPGERTQDNRDKEIIISSPNIDAREIADESGLHLYDDKSEVQSTEYGTPEGSKQSSYTSPKNTDPFEVTMSGISSRNGTSDEMLYSAAEEEMWKQIDAMRKIVGYTASRHGTCVEELKALYVFTGVEPPASFKDPYDLVDVNDKLKFLMSIIGVK